LGRQGKPGRRRAADDGGEDAHADDAPARARRHPRRILTQEGKQHDVDHADHRHHQQRAQQRCKPFSIHRVGSGWVWRVGWSLPCCVGGCGD